MSGADLLKRNKNKLIDLEIRWTGFDRLLPIRLGFGFLIGLFFFFSLNVFWFLVVKTGLGFGVC